MAMIKCTECGREMSDKASNCPNCGCPIEDIRAKLGEIEAAQQEKQKAKEEEKKAKELAAEVKRQKQEEARKAVTPEMKKKRIMIGAAGAVAAVVIVICALYFGVKVPRDKAYQAYLTEVQTHEETAKSCNEAIAQYNEKAKEVIAANDELEEMITSAQALVDCGETPYEGAKITTLSNSIKDARNNETATPELIEIIPESPADPELEKAGKSDIEAATAALVSDDEINNQLAQKATTEMDSLSIPDYTDCLNTLAAQSKDLEDSYAIQKQITAPAEDWVITRLGQVSDIANIAPVTEEHDPNGNLNKPGGYTSTVYFGTSLLGTENLTGDALIEEGTTAGGAIETYATEEDAQSRNSYLGGFDGSILASGSHTVLGTMLIRTSNDLKASQQETLTNAIVEAMTALE
ncbi:MAG: zinc ribbon domain-containing protein [Lachnospiraceae bacterium]|nr:zinc ribbon domain-containing protein [Lachnospiraceae bacterium]